VLLAHAPLPLRAGGTKDKQEVLGEEAAWNSRAVPEEREGAKEARVGSSDCLGMLDQRYHKARRSPSEFLAMTFFNRFLAWVSCMELILFDVVFIP